MQESLIQTSALAKSQLAVFVSTRVGAEYADHRPAYLARGMVTIFCHPLVWGTEPSGRSKRGAVLYWLCTVLIWLSTFSVCFVAKRPELEVVYTSHKATSCSRRDTELLPSCVATSSMLNYPSTAAAPCVLSDRKSVFPGIASMGVST